MVKKKKKQLLKMWERIETNRYYIGSHLGGTFIGNNEIGYIHKSTVAGGHSYNKTFEQMIIQLRNQYWFKKFGG